MSSPARPDGRLLVPLLLALVVAVLAGIFVVPTLVEAFRDGKSGEGPLRYVDPASIKGMILDETAAKALFAPLIGRPSRFQYDPIAWVVHKPDTGQDYMDWPEHPDGRIRQYANNMGFREDAPTQVEKHAYRIFVTGDSHTDGAVNNSESYANVLEALLDRALDPSGATAPVEVINAGVGGTGPHNYLAMVQKYLDLQPDVVIAGLYVGNDFMNALVHSDFITKRKTRGRDADYKAKLNAALEQYPDLPQQGFNQPYLFKYCEGDAEIALDKTVEVFEGIARVCADHHIRFVVLVIPCKADVDGDDDKERIDGLLKILELSPEDFALNRWLSDHFVERLRDEGIDVLDPTQAMIDEPAPLYWRKDHHLSTAGHAFVARLLFEHLRDAVAADVAAGAGAGAGAASGAPAGAPAAGNVTR